MRCTLGLWFALGVAAVAPAALAQPLASAARQAPPRGEQDSSTYTLLCEHLEPSHIAYPIRFAGQEPLIYEASLAAHLVLQRRAWPFAVIATPKIVLRMWTEPEQPIKSPSYMPRLTVLAWLSEPRAGRLFSYASFTLGHHSNGQAGALLTPDGRIDRSADFTTNDLDLSLYAWRPEQDVLGHHQLGLRFITGLFLTPGLRGRLGLWRAHYTTSLYESRAPVRSRLTLSITAILDGLQRSTRDRTLRALHRFPFALQYQVAPRTLQLGLYARYYVGQDYYNLWFDRTIHTLQLGIFSHFGTLLDDT